MGTSPLPISSALIPHFLRTLAEFEQVSFEVIPVGVARGGFGGRSMLRIDALEAP